MSRTVVARARGPVGEVVLRRWDDGVPTAGGPAAPDPGDPPDMDLVVDGVFVMDTADSTTERVLAREALGAFGPGRTGLRVLVGGLGLGFTAAEVLADPRVARAEVVEIQPALVDWLRAGLVPQAVPTMADPRLHVTVGDVVDVVDGLPAGDVDAILLDVDNGPDFLVAAPNARVYAAPFLARAAAALAPGGVLAVWSAGPSPALAAALAAVGPTRVLARPVEREGHVLDYTVFLTRNSPPGVARLTSARHDGRHD